MAIAHGPGYNSVIRAADMVLLARESPLNLAHLRNMVAVTEMGAVECPPAPVLHSRPQSIEQLINQTVGRVLDQYSTERRGFVRRWGGLGDLAPEMPPSDGVEAATAAHGQT